MSTADILGGKVSDDVKAAATERAKSCGEPVDMTDLIQQELKLKEERRKTEAMRRNSRSARSSWFQTLTRSTSGT